MASGKAQVTAKLGLQMVPSEEALGLSFLVASLDQAGACLVTSKDDTHSEGRPTRNQSPAKMNLHSRVNPCTTAPLP